jgi:hypothetical protein
MITTCTECGRAYEASSEECANEPQRECFRCRMNDRNADPERLLDARRTP